MGELYNRTIKQIKDMIQFRIYRIHKKTSKLCDVNIFYLNKKDLLMCHVCKSGGGIICTIQ